LEKDKKKEFDQIKSNQKIKEEIRKERREEERL
jgi:hypothetical protein